MKLILVIAAFVAITQISLINSINVEVPKSPSVPIERSVRSPGSPGHRRSINIERLTLSIELSEDALDKSFVEYQTLCNDSVKKVLSVTVGFIK